MSTETGISMSYKLHIKVLLIISIIVFPATGVSSQDITIDIETKENEEFILPEVEIIETAPPATTSFSGDEAVEHNEFTLAESLSRSAGIYIDQAPKGHSRFKMRGYDMDMIGFLIDGIPINDIYNKNIDIAQIPVFSYSDIKIKRGAASALYGSDAAVGIVELNSGFPETLRIQSGIIFDLNSSDLFNISHTIDDIFNSGITAWVLAEDLLEDFYYKFGSSYYDNGGYLPSESLTTSVKKDWIELVLNPSLYGSSLSSFLSTNDSMLDFAAHTNTWQNLYSKGFNLTAKSGVFIGDNIDTGISSAFNYNEKKSLSYQCGYLTTWDEDNQTWLTTSNPDNDGFTERDWAWPYMFDWYVTPYYEQQLDLLLIKANIYYRMMTNSLVWSGCYSNWFETTCGGRVSTELDLADWNKLTAALILRNDNHTESESFYTSPAPTPLSHYLGGVRPTDSEVPDTVIVKELAGAQAALALEEYLNLSIIEITAGCSYDVQFFYKSSGEEGYWNKNPDGSWYYRLKDNNISSSSAFFLGTRDSINPALNIDFNIIPEILTLDLGGSIKTRFPSFDNYYSDYVDMGDVVFREELKNQVSYNVNLGAEYIILPENLSLRCDVFYTSYTNKLEDYINTGGDTVYFNIPESISCGLEVLSFLDFEFSETLTITGSIGYTLNVGTKSGQAASAFEYNPVHEIIFDTSVESCGELPSKLMVWGRYSTGAVAYRMKSIPPSNGSYPGDYLETVDLHSPFFLNGKIIQRLPAAFSVFFLIENILDSYGIDPFNPGAGRTFSIGLDLDTEDF
jgi:hypothetical protein